MKTKARKKGDSKLMRCRELKWIQQTIKQIRDDEASRKLAVAFAEATSRKSTLTSKPRECSLTQGQRTGLRRGNEPAWIRLRQITLRTSHARLWSLPQPVRSSAEAGSAKSKRALPNPS